MKTINILAMGMMIIFIIAALSYFDLFNITNLLNMSYDIPSFVYDINYKIKTVTSCTQVDIGTEFVTAFGSTNIKLLEDQCEGAGGTWTFADNEVSCELPAGSYDCDGEGIEILEEFCEDNLKANWYCLESLHFAGCLCGVSPPLGCIDTDPDEDPHVYGYCKPIGGVEEYDVCPTTFAVTQLWCSDNGLSCMGASFPCPLGESCKAGVCVKDDWSDWPNGVEPAVICGEDGDDWCQGTCPTNYECESVDFPGDYSACTCINPNTGTVHDDWKPDGVYHNPQDEGVNLDEFCYYECEADNYFGGYGGPCIGLYHMETEENDCCCYEDDQLTIGLWNNYCLSEAQDRHLDGAVVNWYYEDEYPSCQDFITSAVCGHSPMVMDYWWVTEDAACCGWDCN